MEELKDNFTFCLFTGWILFVAEIITVAVMFTDSKSNLSCYRGGDVHCGKCGTCVERKEAFRDAGIKDLTKYNE